MIEAQITGVESFGSPGLLLELVGWTPVSGCWPGDGELFPGIHRCAWFCSPKRRGAIPLRFRTISIEVPNERQRAGDQLLTRRIPSNDRHFCTQKSMALGCRLLMWQHQRTNCYSLLWRTQCRLRCLRLQPKPSWTWSLTWPVMMPSLMNR